ncbi:MAG: ArsA family ATPase [Deltaproteobacteria bacterium]|nr:ArsA family ATPase [Deltaproteobacteria bacterium]
MPEPDSVKAKPHDLLTRRFIAVTGKGGTGKSAVSAAIAFAAATLGRRVLVASIQRYEKTTGFLGAGAPAGEVFEVQNNVFAVNITPKAALREYGLMILRFERLYRRVFEDTLVRYLMEALPSLEELVMIGKAWYHTQERQETGAWRYDTVVLDMQSTGHALSMLSLPATITKAAPPGPLRSKAKEILAAVTDPKRASLCVVTTPEETPVNEAAEICERNAAEAGMPPGFLFVNRVIEPEFGPSELDLGAELPPRALLRTAFVCASFRERVARSQSGHLARAQRDIPLPAVILPEVFSEEFGTAELAALSKIITEHCHGSV